MDGNGRWAKARYLPRTAGHHQGVKVARKVVEICAREGVEVLTLFAFSSENWKRPQGEVSTLMELFISALRREAKDLAKNNVRLQVIGDRSGFPEKLQDEMSTAEKITADSTGMRLLIAANYGGRWDLIQAMQQLGQRIQNGELAVEDITETMIGSVLSTANLPEPDLFIRTGGEHRISNFLLWQLAYTELFFTEKFWPEFDEDELQKAFQVYQQRERRFGMISEQINA
ncbi:MAG TPA: di-trans,poly-cis-decaprenylcistransferase [Chromatiales bacterium]|nr:di-trans,poly-cis-decaprenylcistransferase [Thiotrichales bacterium]HIP67129.1 di-trans,poly-cis-decaprenylcistransferase [Chromatiales bacterium]